MKNKSLSLCSLHLSVLSVGGRRWGQQQHSFYHNLFITFPPHVTNDTLVPYCCLMCNTEELDYSSAWLVLMTELSRQSHFQLRWHCWLLLPKEITKTFKTSFEQLVPFWDQGSSIFTYSETNLEYFIFTFEGDFISIQSLNWATPNI